jgi:hypothetical protein
VSALPFLSPSRKDAVDFVEQILHLPFAYLWLPSLVFFGIVGGVYGTYWMTRPAPDAPPAEKPQPAKPPDQRAAHRRIGNPVQVHVGTPADKSTPEHGCVLDRSVGGMRLALYREVETGTVLSIRPVHAENMVPWVDLAVRSCRTSSDMTGQFEVGCQYVKSPPYSIQLLFG